ncbi:hypothetical protein AB5J49_46875 [Streptomyces sp. R28]|uniref:Condensation domain-containing protein n=1 Tax=Streptomyces sp. R28 TaxID=3238628 RepID=A0AB39QDB1_9ACTN
MKVENDAFCELTLHGPETGPFPLTWGQGNMWESIVALGSRSSRLNISWTFAVKNGVRVPDALTRIRNCLAQFDIFRVSFDEQRVEQTFKEKADVRVYVSEAPTAAIRENPFAFDETPIRLELLHAGGLVTHTSVVLSHLAFDGGACRPLTGILRDAIEGHGVPAQGMQTEELIGYERSAAGVRRSNAVIGGWVSAATRLPPGRGLLSTTAGADSVISIRSRATSIASQTLSLRIGASASSVILAALARVVRQDFYSGLSAMPLVCNNRMQPGLSEFIGQTLGNGLFILPERVDAEFSSYVRNAYSRALGAYRRARYDCFEWRNVLTDLSAKGLATDLSYYFNDVRAERDPWAGLENQMSELRAGVTRPTSIETVEWRGMSDATCFASLDSIDQDCLLTLVCDDSQISESDAVGVLETLEDLLVKEALKS